MNNLKFENLKHLFPDKTSVNKSGRLEINNNDISDLVNEFGSPLYIYDENTIRNVAKNYLNKFKSQYENVHVSYSSSIFKSNPFTNFK